MRRPGAPNKLSPGLLLDPDLDAASCFEGVESVCVSFFAVEFLSMSESMHRSSLLVLSRSLAYPSANKANVDFTLYNIQFKNKRNTKKKK